MNKEIIILEEPPVILTKDEKFMKDFPSLGPVRPGQMRLLPQDAVLIKWKVPSMPEVVAGIPHSKKKLS